jgi:hypothetical protein
MTATLYGDLLAAGIPMANHESDLYFADTSDSRAILARFSYSAKLAIRFGNSQNGEIWWDVPFAFLPWWEGREAGRQTVERWIGEIMEPGDLKDS